MAPDPLLNWPIVFNDGKGGKIPERAVSSTSENIVFKVFGQQVEITGGFMEVHPDHSQKSPSHAILSSDPQKIVELPPAHHNLGIDYTAYAHLDNIDPNLKEGTRVAQQFDRRYFRAIW